CRATLEDHIRRMVGIRNPQIALQHLDEWRRVLAPTGSPEIDLGYASHPVAPQKISEGGLGGSGQLSRQRFAGQRCHVGLSEVRCRICVGPDDSRRSPERQVHLGGDVVWQPTRRFQYLPIGIGQISREVMKKSQGSEAYSKPGYDNWCEGDQ